MNMRKNKKFAKGSITNICCQKEIHRIGISKKGRIVLFDHSLEDIKAELVVYAMGGEISQCAANFIYLTVLFKALKAQGRIESKNVEHFVSIRGSVMVLDHLLKRTKTCQIKKFSIFPRPTRVNNLLSEDMEEKEYVNSSTAVCTIPNKLFPLFVKSVVRRRNRDIKELVKRAHEEGIQTKKYVRKSDLLDVDKAEIEEFLALQSLENNSENPAIALDRLKRELSHVYGSLLRTIADLSGYIDEVSGLLSRYFYA